MVLRISAHSVHISTRYDAAHDVRSSSMKHAQKFYTHMHTHTQRMSRVIETIYMSVCQWIYACMCVYLISKRFADEMLQERLEKRLERRTEHGHHVHRLEVESVYTCTHTCIHTCVRMETCIRESRVCERCSYVTCIIVCYSSVLL